MRPSPFSKGTRSFFTSGLAVAASLFFFLTSVVAGEPQPTTSPEDSSRPLAPIEKKGPGLFRIGEIQIHKGTRSVTFPAEVNMDKGILEYLLVRSSGKTHESLLRTEVDPYLLNVALLLLSFEGTDRAISAQGVDEAPRGEPVSITIVCQHQGKTWKGPAHEWVTRRTDKNEDSPPLSWVYTGSAMLKGNFLAQSEGSIAAIYHDPAALIDHATEGGDNDEIWHAKEGVVPPVGTPVTVIIAAAERNS